MKSMLLMLSLLFGSVPLFATAQVREMTQADLRAAVASDQAIASLRLINGVETYTGGSVVNIRAFETDGAVTYRILVQQEDGQLGAILLDAATGRVVTPSVQVGQEVTAFARKTQAAASSRDDNQGNRANSNADNGNNGKGNSGNNNGNRGNGNNGNGNGNN